MAGKTWSNSLRVLEVLDFLSHHPGASAAEVIAGAHLTRATAHRLLAQLERAGWIAVTPKPRRFGVGVRFIAVAARASRTNRARQMMLRYLAELAETVGLTCGLGFYDRGHVVFTDEANRLHNTTTVYPTGDEIPAVAVSGGRVLLAFQPPDEIDRVLSDELRAFTAKTHTDPDDLRMELDRARQLGYATNDQEYTEHSGIAVPIMEASGQAIACFTCRTNEPEPLSKAFIDRVLPSLKYAAMRVSTDLGVGNPGRRPIA